MDDFSIKKEFIGKVYTTTLTDVSEEDFSMEKDIGKTY